MHCYMNLVINNKKRSVEALAKTWKLDFYLDKEFTESYMFMLLN